MKKSTDPRYSNLTFEAEPDYSIWYLDASRSQWRLYKRNDRTSWKRMSALSHARALAHRAPDWCIEVRLNVLY